MKQLIGIVFSACFVFFLIFLHSCTIAPPSTTQNPAATATPSTGNVVVNDASTGTCPIHVWLDATGPVNIAAGNIYTFTNVNPGSHNLTFSTNTTVSCGVPTVTCNFTNNGTTTGYSCSFNLNSNQTETAGITDNGCNQMTVANPE